MASSSSSSGRLMGRRQSTVGVVRYSSITHQAQIAFAPPRWMTGCVPAVRNENYQKKKKKKKNIGYSHCKVLSITLFV